MSPTSGFFSVFFFSFFLLLCRGLSSLVTTRDETLFQVRHADEKEIEDESDGDSDSENDDDLRDRRS
jgi:hypothetical protein